jgi:hypothetical protein
MTYASNRSSSAATRASSLAALNYAAPLVSSLGIHTLMLSVDILQQNLIAILMSLAYPLSNKVHSIHHVGFLSHLPLPIAAPLNAIHPQFPLF